MFNCVHKFCGAMVPLLPWTMNFHVWAGSVIYISACSLLEFMKQVSCVFECSYIGLELARHWWSAWMWFFFFFFFVCVCVCVSTGKGEGVGEGIFMLGLRLSFVCFFYNLIVFPFSKKVAGLLFQCLHLIFSYLYNTSGFLNLRVKMLPLTETCLFGCGCVLGIIYK